MLESDVWSPFIMALTLINYTQQVHNNLYAGKGEV